MHVLQGDTTTEDYNNIAVRINPIMDTGAYGIRVWGNRVFNGSAGVDALKYSDFLNVRLLVCDIKKQLYHSALRMTFEPNDDIAWLNYKTLNNTLLDRMQSGRGIQWYRWAKLSTNEKATLKALLTIKPIEALEYFDITVNLTDSDVEITE